MGRIAYTEIVCKSALNRVEGMPFRWSLNPYRGCSHACHYCYARATHAYYGMNADEDFETKILVKVNFPEVLRRELARPSWAGECVSLGTATDPYQPGEGRYRVTRSTLEALRDRGNPVSVVTKSTLVLRDLDLLVELARVADVAVHFSVITLDPAIWHAVEPGTPPPWQRLAVMRRLVEAGVPCSVFLAPILPGITDSEDAIEAVVRAAKEHGADRIWASPLRLAPLVKEHYLGFVAQAFPALLHRYERAYVGPNAPAAYWEALHRRVDRIRLRYGFSDDRAAGSAERRPASGPGELEHTVHQLALAW
jgi:DNA repair photolyase